MNSATHKFTDKKTPIVVNVFYHFIKGNTFGEQNPEQKVEEMTILLNENFNGHNLFIRNSGYDIIHNESYVSTTTTTTTWEFKNKLVKVNKKANAIDIYVNDKHLNDKGDNLSGQTNGILSKAFIVRSDYALSYTVPHEFAHCLGLYHTYETKFDSQSSSCDASGDFVCDTPLDKIPKKGTSPYTDPPSCAYTGNENINPDVKNTMARYYNCREHFTIGQAYRMRYFLATRTELKPVTTTVGALLSPQKNTISKANYVNCPGTGEICDQGVHALKFQKGFSYTIKYRDNPLKEITATFSATQTPIIHGDQYAHQEHKDRHHLFGRGAHLQDL